MTPPDRCWDSVRFVAPAALLALAAGCAHTSPAVSPAPVPMAARPTEAPGYGWHDFELSPASPVAFNGDFRLVKVLDDGTVQLMYHNQELVAGPKDKPLTRDFSRLPVVVVSSDPQSQTAHLQWLTTN